MAIERDLHDLLHCHDCVIVPQWGGFLTHYRSARLDQARSVVHPPGKDLSFNRQLSRNDGLLADHLAKRTGMAFDAATTRINEEVAGWRSALERHGRLELPHIGIFYRDADHNLQFDPDRRTNYLKDAYGLRPVAAVAVQRAMPKREVIALPAPTKAAKEKPPVMEDEAAVDIGRRTPVLWAAAIVTAVLFSAAAFWLVQQDAMENLQWSSLDPFSKPPQRTYVPSLPQQEPRVSTAGMFSLPDELLGVRELPLTTNDSVTLIVDLETPATPVLVPDSVAVRPSPKAETAVVRARFHVVGGCFAEPTNAERFLEELLGKGHPAVQLDLHKGLHPVAFGSYATRREALDALESIRSQGAGSAWLLVR
jgi:hypothetical protein